MHPGKLLKYGFLLIIIRRCQAIIIIRKQKCKNGKKMIVFIAWLKMVVINNE